MKNKKNIVFKIKSRKKIAFSILIIILGVLFGIFIFIKKPKTLSDNNLYSEKDIFSLENVSFPLIEKIDTSDKSINAISLNLGDNSINKFKYKIQILDKTNKVLFTHDFVNYSGYNYYLYFGNNSTDELILKIDCPKCNNVKVDTATINSNVSLNGTKKKSLKVGFTNYSIDYQYYWYSLMLILFGSVLLIFARSEEDEK